MQNSSGKPNFDIILRQNQLVGSYKHFCEGMSSKKIAFLSKIPGKTSLCSCPLPPLLSTRFPLHKYVNT